MAKKKNNTTVVKEVVEKETKTEDTTTITEETNVESSDIVATNGDSQVNSGSIVYTDESKQSIDDKKYCYSPYDVKCLTIEDLISYNKAADIVFSYYDNSAKMMNNDYSAQSYSYRANLEKYRKLKMNLFREMERRMDLLEF